MPTVIEKKPIREVSYDRIDTLHPKIRAAASAAYKEAVRITPKGVHPVINEGLRSFERQNYLYSLGRTRKNPDGGGIVTYAKAGQGFHGYGLAIDFFLLVNGKQHWKVDKNWMLVVKAFEEQGFEWGGKWSKPDYPHLQKAYGYTWKQLLQLHNSGKVDLNGYVLI